MPRKSLDELVDRAAKAPTAESRRLIAQVKKRVAPTLLKNPGGAPSTFTDDIGETICKGLANGKTLTKLCEELKLAPETIYGWVRQNESFSENYHNARASMAKTLIDKLVDESEAIDADNVLAAKVRADILRWVATRYAPSQFADSKRIELAGEVHHRHSHELTDIQKKKIAESWLMSRQELPALSVETSGPNLDELEQRGVQPLPEERELPRRKVVASKVKRRNEDDW